MPSNRRTFLAGVSTALVGTVGFGTAIAAEDSQLRFAEINPEKETLVISNTGDTEFDLSGYYMEFEYKQNVSQSRPFPEGTTISAGGSLTVASGAKDDNSADVTFDYDDYEVINNEGDKVAVLTPDESEAVISHTIGEPLPDAPEDTSSDESSNEKEESSPDTSGPSESESDSSDNMEDDSQSDSSDGSSADESDADTESDPSSDEDSDSGSSSKESPVDTDDSTKSSADDSGPADSSSPVEEDGC